MRNFYLTAEELRDGVAVLPTPHTASADSVRAMSPELFFDYFAGRLNGAKAGNRKITINVHFPDVDAAFTLMLRTAHSPNATERMTPPTCPSPSTAASSMT